MTKPIRRRAPGAGRKPDPTPRKPIKIRLPLAAHTAITTAPNGYAKAKAALVDLAAKLTPPDSKK